MDTKRFLLAALLSMAVLFAWNWLFPPPKPAPPVEPAPQATAPAPAPAPVASAPQAAPAAAPPAEAVEPVEAAGEERVVLESGEVRAEFTNRGAELASFTLERYAGSDGSPLELVRRREQAPYFFAFADSEGRPLPVGGALFAVERATGEPAVSFRYAGAHGVAEKRFALRPDGLLELAVEADLGAPWTLVLGPGIRNPPAEELASRFVRRGAAIEAGGKLSRFDAAGTKEPVLVAGGGLRWAALQDTYFLAAVIPQQPIAQVALQPAELPALAAAEEPAPTPELRLLVAPGAGGLQALAYLGPKDYERLRGLPGGLAKSIDFGMFSFLAKPLLFALRWVHDHLIANYGWAIVLLTFAIRLLLFPLNHKSIVSMEKMQRVQPKAQAIQQKWRAKLRDKQGRPDREAQAKMHQEIMALYQAEGVNPAAGCLPLLLQMPVLFAFYSLLGSAFELRGAPWFGWVQDLSIRDPYYVLPLVMGASMVLQTKLTPTPADGVQRWMMLLMPVVFTFFFLGFPAGLVLYWLVNNVLAIAQQLGYRKWRTAPVAAEVDAGAKGKGKRRGKR